MSANDVDFSPSNPWLGNPSAKANRADGLLQNRHATIVLIPGAPRTVLNLPAARHATEGFLKDGFS